MHVARRALHGAIVAGVLAGGMAFSGGIASADTCTADGVTYTGPASLISGGSCSAEALASGLLTKYTPPSEDTTETTKPTEPSKPVDTGTVPSVLNPPDNAPKPTDETPNGTPASGQPAGGQQPGVAGSQQPAGAVAAAQPASGASLAAASAAGSLPADSALLTAPAFGAAPTGVYDPALLLGAPGMSPLVQAASADPASAVTTASQVQAMALTNVPKELGIPAVIGVIILAGLGAFVVRHRVLRRVKKAATS